MSRINIQDALNTLNKMKDSLIERMVEDLSHHQDDDPTSFALQEIEDRFAMRLANMNTLILTLQDHIDEYPDDLDEPTSIGTKIRETDKVHIKETLDEMLEDLTSDELLKTSIIPCANETFLIIILYKE